MVMKRPCSLSVFSSAIQTIRLYVRVSACIYPFVFVTPSICVAMFTRLHCCLCPHMFIVFCAVCVLWKERRRLRYVDINSENQNSVAHVLSHCFFNHHNVCIFTLPLSEERVSESWETSNVNTLFPSPLPYIKVSPSYPRFFTLPTILHSVSFSLSLPRNYCYYYFYYSLKVWVFVSRQEWPYFSRFSQTGKHTKEVLHS
jgi:hypothetical protein